MVDADIASFFDSIRPEVLRAALEERIKERAERSLATLEEVLADLGLSLAAAKTSLVDLRVPKAGFSFLGFHHRRVESFSRKGRYFCARWPSERAVRRAKDKIRSHTDRRWLLLRVKDIVERLNRYLVGWRGYFAYGNSTTVLHDFDEFVTDGADGSLHLEEAWSPRKELRPESPRGPQQPGSCPPGGKRPARPAACRPVKGCG